MKRRLVYSIALTAILLTLFIDPQPSFCQSGKIFRTKYSTIHYSDKKDMNDFIWRLGGQKLEFSNDIALASTRVDRIIERVLTILDMWPGRFNVAIYVHRGLLEAKRVGYYDPKTKAVHISADYASDGVFAHEVAHAVINHNYNAVLPSKVQEILTQYVDKYLYNDY